MTLHVDRAAWGRTRVTGGDRARFLQGLTTINVDKLADGDHAWGAILSPKGRVLSIIDLTREADAFVIACEPALVEPTRALLDRYAVMDDVAFELLPAGPAYQAWTDAASVWTAPIVLGEVADLVADTAPAAEELRLRAGFPRYGVDVDDDHFPFETPLAARLDYKKGCYVGQEPVFRVYAQGQAQRQQRALVIEGVGPIAAGTPIAHAAKPQAGVITSSLARADGTTIALAYVHRAAVDGPIQVDGRAGTSHALPYDA